VFKSLLIEEFGKENEKLLSILISSLVSLFFKHDTYDIIKDSAFSIDSSCISISPLLRILTILLIISTFAV
jgi:hypothetical protein